MKSQDGQKIIDINETTLSFTITGKSYECFDELSNDLDSIISFLNLCSISNVKRLAIRKINIVEFENNENPSEILTYLLNPDLVGENVFCLINDYYPNPNPNGTITLEWINNQNEMVSVEVGNSTFSYFVELSSEDVQFFNKKNINEREAKKLSEYIQVL